MTNANNARNKAICAARLKGKTYAEIAERWGVSRQRVHQVILTSAPAIVRKTKAQSKARAASRLAAVKAARKAANNERAAARKKRQDDAAALIRRGCTQKALAKFLGVGVPSARALWWAWEQARPNLPAFPPAESRRAR